MSQIDLTWSRTCATALNFFFWQPSCSLLRGSEDLANWPVGRGTWFSSSSLRRAAWVSRECVHQSNAPPPETGKKGWAAAGVTGAAHPHAVLGFRSSSSFSGFAGAVFFQINGGGSRAAAATAAPPENPGNLPSQTTGKTRLHSEATLPARLLKLLREPINVPPPHPRSRTPHQVDPPIGEFQPSALPWPTPAEPSASAASSSCWLSRARPGLSRAAAVGL